MATAGASEAHPSRGHATARIKAVAWLAVLALAATMVWVVLHDHGSGGADASSTGSSAQAVRENRAVAASSVKLYTLTDRRAGFRVELPEDWTEVAEPHPRSAFGKHVFSIGGQNAVSIETFQLDHPIANSDVRDMRAVTDAILSSPKARLTVLDVRQVEIAGLSAIYYLYYFPAGRQQGIHAHYFIFDGSKMNTVIFQVVPATDFTRYANQFDRLVASFRPLTN